MQLREEFSGSLTVVSPDAGGVTRAKAFQEQLEKFGSYKSDLAIILKNRDAPGSVSEMHLIGNVKDKDVIIIDDMIDTGGTLAKAVGMLKEQGAGQVYCFATHGLFSGKALDNLQNSKIDEVVISNTIPAKDQESQCNKFKRLSIGIFLRVANLLAEAIRRIQQNESVSYLFTSS